MATATSEIMNVPGKGDVPVWCIREQGGDPCYVERQTHTGLVPADSLNVFHLGESVVSVHPVAQRHQQILTAQDGFVPPLNWYQSPEEWTRTHQPDYEGDLDVDSGEEEDDDWLPATSWRRW